MPSGHGPFLFLCCFSNRQELFCFWRSRLSSIRTRKRNAATDQRILDPILSQALGKRFTPRTSERTPITAIKPTVEEIFKVVEENPRFPGCEDLAGSKEEKEKCSKEKLLEFIYKNIKYPAIARENGIQGMCVVRFVVEKNGSITDIELVRDIGAGCGEEAVRVVGLMNEMGERWSPGRQRGQPVRVQYNLPVRFKLEN